MLESDRIEMAAMLQNKTALSRLSHVEVVAAIEFLEAVGYDVTKKPEYEEDKFKLEDLREEPSLPAVIEGEDHSQDVS